MSVESELTSIRASIDSYASRLSKLDYLFNIYTKDTNEHISYLQKRLDCLEHPR
jgi:hypothetical protein